MNSNLNSVYPLSYSTFLNDIQRFKKSGGPNSDSFNFFDSPSHKYYKIFFYFGTKSENTVLKTSSEYSGLLAPTWIYGGKHFEELSNLGYYTDKYFVNEPFPASEPWNTDMYETRIDTIANDLNKFEEQMDLHGMSISDYEYYKLALSANGHDISNLTGSSDYTGNIIHTSGETVSIRVKFENGMLKNAEFLNNNREEIRPIYESLRTHSLERIEATKTRDDMYKSLLKATSDKENYLKRYNKYVNDFKSNYEISSYFEANQYYLFNTAWAYLILQGYHNKARQLRQFIELLSNISIESPWYFSAISGISDALNRKCTSADGAKMDLGMRSKITIKCLPDAFDNRIGTLLDLYRSVVFDWNNKREIIPANLRKFDMAIYVFEAPDQRWHKEEREDLTKIADKWTEAYNDSIGNTLKSIFPNAINNNEQSNYNKGSASLIGIDEDGNFNFLASHKLIEFHDCEINYNTGTSAWAALDNKLGFTPEYNIEISFGDCYEISYNDLFQQYYGDSLIITDESNTKFYNDQRELLNKRIEKNTDSWTKRLGIGLLNRLNDKGLSLAKKLSFGNLYGFSLTDTLNQISNGIQNPMMAFDTVKNYVKNGKNRTINRVKRRELGSDSNIANNGTLTNSARNELSSDNNISDNNIITNSARNELSSDNNIADNGILTYNARQDLGSDSNINDNNVINTEKGVRYLRGNIFSNYTKNKVLKSEKTESIGNIFKASTVANNL